ncbi:hypothetical protein HPB47_020981 [Ixodes persulcatus]|uniref:Uncharacterized protein n=1 Tax=Ixodes persulcatus TaxID=34615 RepID=A0AC60QDV1_IXOPE|nr:hypothetical protein HPB47_020981 [Ixodes persulcatus]
MQIGFANFTRSRGRTARPSKLKPCTFDPAVRLVVLFVSTRWGPMNRSRNNVDCEHAAVLDVKRMGQSNFAIVSFDTPRLPKTVRYFTELCSVSPYVPRTLVRFHCHKDGHLQKHCPNAAVCKTSGKQQHEGACATPAAYCTLCTAEGHLATDPKCPERERRLEENKRRTERRSRSRSRRRTANAAAAPAHVSSPMPSDLSTDFPPLSPDAPLTPVTTKGSYRSPARKAVNFATSCTSATPLAGTTYATATSGKPKRSKKASARTKQEIQELTTRICELQQRLEELYQVQKEQEQEEEREHQQQLREERRRRARANNERRSSQSPALPRRTETPTPDPAEAITLSQIQAMIVQTLRNQLPRLLADHFNQLEVTSSGQRLLLSDDPTMAAILDEVPPHVPPWKDFPITDGRPLSRKTNAQRYCPQRATIARALNEPSTDPAEMRLFTVASWNPHTQIAAIVARTEDGCHRRQNYRLDETPSTTEVELQALQVGINWILMDPRLVGTTEYAIKNGCRIIKAQKDVAVKIQWVPGHSGQADNEAAHDLASEACTSRRSQGVPIYRPSLDHSPEEERRRRKQIRKSRLKDHVPPLENSFSRGLPRGAQVLVVKARTGFAITEDMMAKWRYNRLCHQEGDPPPPPVKRCSSCSADQAPTIRHLIWECDGLKDVREKHRPPGVTSYEEWVTPVQDQKTTLLALWSFACEASIVCRT